MDITTEGTLTHLFKENGDYPVAVSAAEFSLLTVGMLLAAKFLESTVDDTVVDTWPENVKNEYVALMRSVTVYNNWRSAQQAVKEKANNNVISH